MLSTLKPTQVRLGHAGEVYSQSITPNLSKVDFIFTLIKCHHKTFANDGIGLASDIHTMP